MPVFHPEFDKMHKEMLAMCKRLKAENASPEVQDSADRVTRWLWMLANNETLSPGTLNDMAADLRKFEAAKAAAAGGSSHDH